MQKRDFKRVRLLWIIKYLIRFHVFFFMDAPILPMFRIFILVKQLTILIIKILFASNIEKLEKKREKLYDWSKTATINAPSINQKVEKLKVKLDTRGRVIGLSSTELRRGGEKKRRRWMEEMVKNDGTNNVAPLPSHPLTPSLPGISFSTLPWEPAW